MMKKATATHGTRAPMLIGRAAAQIDSAGAIVRFNVGERGYLRFIPMSTIHKGS